MRQNFDQINTTFRFTRKIVSKLGFFNDLLTNVRLVISNQALKGSEPDIGVSDSKIDLLAKPSLSSNLAQ